MTVKECRIGRGLSIQEMALQLGVHKNKYKYYEKFPNKVPVHIAKLFSIIVHVPLDEIFFE